MIKGSSVQDRLAVDRSPLEARPLGARIGSLRKANGLTLAQVAEACGFSEATLSRIERGQSDISAHHLFLLAGFLGVDMAELFNAGAAPLTKGMRSITRAGEGEKRPLARYHSEILNSDLSRKGMHPSINHITAKTLEEVDGLSSHTGEEFLYVLSGRVAIHTDLYTPTILGAGDSLYFDGSMAHAYLNAGADPAIILVVVGEDAAKDRDT